MARGLCTSHLRQAQRRPESPLLPLSPPRDGSFPHCVSVRLSEAAYEALFLEAERRNRRPLELAREWLSAAITKRHRTD